MNKITPILAKIYHFQNAFFEGDLYLHKVPESVSFAELILLKEHHLEPNQIETITHDQALKRFFILKENTGLNLTFGVALFLNGLTQKNVRGLQTLMSLLFLKNITDHQFIGNEHCEICGLSKSDTIDKTHKLFTYYLGYSNNELPLSMLIELEEIQSFKIPEITNEELAKITELLNFINQADPEETPSQLEKRMAKTKILPKIDKYKRLGILQTLAECGILTNLLCKPMYEGTRTQKEFWDAHNKIKDSNRSDIVLPLAGWRGINKVNFERAKEIFEEL